MQNNHDGRESDHQDGGVQRAQGAIPRSTLLAQEMSTAIPAH